MFGEPIKIGIVGAGNVGRVLGVILSVSGYSVEVVTGTKAHNIQIDNYSAYEIAGDFGNKSYLVKVIPEVNNLQDNLDMIFVCTKIFDAIPVLRILQKKIKPDGAIVTIQNNFWIDRVVNYINPENLVLMYLDFSCATIGKRTQVRNFDGIKLGVLRKEAYQKMEVVHDILSNVCKVKDTSDIIGLTIGRSIINTTISSLGAISGLKLKDILLDRNGRYLFIKSIEEKVKLFKSVGIKITPYDNKLDYYMFVENSWKGKIYRHKIIKLLINNNGNIRSSALRDFENKRKCELIVTLDSFLKHSVLKKIDTPYTREIYSMLNEISKGERTIYADAFYEKRLVDIGVKKW